LSCSRRNEQRAGCERRTAIGAFVAPRGENAARSTFTVDIPGSEPLRLDCLLLDVNGTLTDRATLIEGVQERLARLSEALDVRLLSADTFGSLDAIAEQLGLKAARISRGEEKRAYLERLGPERCAAIGNGANDAAMLARLTWYAGPLSTRLTFS
jgi:soluble P-type ATPase